MSDHQRRRLRAAVTAKLFGRKLSGLRGGPVRLPNTWGLGVVPTSVYSSTKNIVISAIGQDLAGSAAAAAAVAAAIVHQTRPL